MKQQRFIIRPAQACDISKLARLMVVSYRYGFSDILTDEILASRNEDFFSARFVEQWPSIQLAETAGGACIGLIQVRNSHLDMIFIAPEWAGSTLAQTLLQNAEACGAVTLECFRDNSRARRFYERSGWTLSGAYNREFAGTQHAFVTYAKPATGVK